MKKIITLMPVLAALIAITTARQQQAESTNRTSDTEPASSKLATEVFVKPIAATEQKIVVTMKRVFRPLFNDLKAEIGTDAKPNDADFDNIAKTSLMLSEFLARIHQWPDIGAFESAAQRAKYAEMQKDLAITETHSDAVLIYQAAEEQDVESAKKHFVSMTNNCNVCHQKRKSRWAPVILKH